MAPNWKWVAQCVAQLDLDLWQSRRDAQSAPAKQTPRWRSAEDSKESSAPSPNSALGDEDMAIRCLWTRA